MRWFLPYYQRSKILFPLQKRTTVRWTRYTWTVAKWYWNVQEERYSFENENLNLDVFKIFCRITIQLKTII